MEKISFKITFSTELEKNANDPCAEILLNSIIVVPRQPIKNNQTIEFTCELFEDMNYELAIYRSNHNEKDKQILSIKNFQVDDIDLNKLLDEMYFYPIYPALWHKQQTDAGIEWPAKQKGWRSWGFNGKWVMNFDTPFYTWLLKKT